MIYALIVSSCTWTALVLLLARGFPRCSGFTKTRKISDRPPLVVTDGSNVIVPPSFLLGCFFLFSCVSTRGRLLVQTALGSTGV